MSTEKPSGDFEPPPFLERRGSGQRSGCSTDRRHGADLDEKK